MVAMADLYADGQYVLFADESDYAEMYEEIEG